MRDNITSGNDSWSGDFWVFACDKSAFKSLAALEEHLQLHLHPSCQADSCYNMQGINADKDVFFR